jgi:hypothetical protein
MVTTDHSPRRVLAAIAVPAAMVCAAAGCDDGGSANTQPVSPPGASVISPAPNRSSIAPGSPGTGTGTGGVSASPNAALLRAGASAEAAVPGSTLISIETEANGARWEAQVVTANGVEHELDISRGGRKVVSGPRVEHEDAGDRAKHRRRVHAARLDYRRAVAVVATAVKGATITELNLDTYRGKTVWEADVNAPSGVRHALKVDAGTGRIVGDKVGSD